MLPISPHTVAVSLSAVIVIVVRAAWKRSKFYENCHDLFSWVDKEKDAFSGWREVLLSLVKASFFF